MTVLPTYSLALVAPTVGVSSASGNSTPWPVVSAFFKASEKRLLLRIRCDTSQAGIWLLNLGAGSVQLSSSSESCKLLPATSSAFVTNEQGTLTLELQVEGGQTILFAAKLPLPKARTARLWQRVLRRQRLPAAWLQLLKSELEQWLRSETLSDPRLLEAVKLIDSMEGSVLSIEQLSKLVGMNTTSLKKAFKEFTGNSIFKYQQIKRLQRAAQSLMQAELDLSSIAEQAGYLNQRHFATAFKKQFGCSPATFRANQK